jgi:acyl-ACP thioesterase
LKDGHRDPIYVWQDEYKIHSYEVDTKGQATIPFLCQFMQESAWHHAEHLGVGYAALREKNSAWVLSRQWVAIDTFPRWGDTIQIHTWPTGRERLFWYRDFKILDGQANPIGRATTAWLVIDLTRRRPQRSDIIDLNLPGDAERMFPRRPGKITSPNHGKVGHSTRVGFRDLDVNQHVNNIRYIDWILDAFDLGFHEAHSLQELEINYMAEAAYGDEVSVVQESGANLTFLHRLERNGDQMELSRARTVWQIGL